MPVYSAYGLAIRSDLELPALATIDSDAIDITISAGSIASDAGGSNKFRNWEAEPGRFLSHFFNVGRILVTGGDTILYERDDATDDSQIVSILLGTGLAAAMMQRKLLPIHACSVLTDRGAVLVMGRSGAGKSTTLGGLLKLGLPMLADDVTGLALDPEGRPIAVPGFPAMRLWQDSLDHLGESSEGLVHVRSDMQKYYLPIANFHAEPAPIRSIIHLTTSNETALKINPIDPMHSVEVLSRFIFRKNFIEGMNLRPFAFKQVTRTVDQAIMLRVTRPITPIAPRELAQMIIERLDTIEAVATS